jgi:H+/Cl- antiporter ClcA
MRRDHPVAAGLKRDFGDWRLWWTRVVIFAVAALAGLAVVGFTWLTERALGAFSALQAAWWWAPLLWTPLCAGGIVGLTRRLAPGAAGSGIPQVMAALDPALDARQGSALVSLKLSLAKVVLTAAGLLAGLSLGREGPTVQIAAGILLGARRLLPRRSVVTEHGLLVAGGAAGIAAAFNTPLAGVMFAIEELSRSPEQRNSGLIVAAIVLAGLIAVSINGNATYFGVIRVAGVGLPLVVPGLLVALCSGVAGGLFARLLLRSLGGQGTDAMSRLRKARPVQFAALCGLVVAVIGVVTGGATFGSGYEHTRSMLEGTESSSPLYVLLKFMATWLTAWSGVPAGIFAPSLAIGAALGNDVAMLTHYPEAATIIALGMVGFLAAATQAPLTAFIIVMEMVDGHALVLSLMACSLVASALSRAFSRPLYGSLAVLQSRQARVIEAEAPAAPAGERQAAG